MAKRKVTQKSVEFKIFMAIWDFWKNYGNPENTDEYWHEVINRGSNEVALNDEYKEAWDLSLELFNAVLNVLDARNRSKKLYGDYEHGYEIMLKDEKRKNGK